MTLIPFRWFRRANLGFRYGPFVCRQKVLRVRGNGKAGNDDPRLIDC